MANKPIYIYFSSALMNESKRGMIFPLLKPFMKPDDYPDVQRTKDYGVSETQFVLTADQEKADISVLPLAWEYYVKNNKVGEVMSWISTCQGPVWSWNTGDHGVDTPDLPSNVTVYRLSGYKSRQKPWERGIPPFFHDPLETLQELGGELTVPSADEISVGFCGQAGGGNRKYLLDNIRTIRRNISYNLKKRVYQPHSIRSSTRIRAIQLKTLEGNKEIKADFIIRKKYRAGAKDQADRDKTKLDFLMNMNRNVYTACARGGGNFSVRLFETMAMGRIPVQIDTDGIYPLPEIISWEEQTCFIPVQKISKCDHMLIEYHKTHEIVNIMALNRKLWQEHLTLGGFFTSEYEILKNS